jgi:phosphoadenosine phosphosulfate reductase
VRRVIWGRESAALESATPRRRLERALELFGSDLLFTSSFGTGSAVLLHLWSEVARELPVVFIDTGFLFDETHVYKNELAALLHLNVQVVKPLVPQVDFLYEHGADISTRDPDFCCKHNRIGPIDEHVKRAKGWLSGLRRDQSKARADVAILEPTKDGPVKVYPLASMTSSEVQLYLAKHQLPEHPLQAKRYLSVGCAPCTQPVADGEDERSGRWAGTTKTECGLHTFLKPLT